MTNIWLGLECGIAATVVLALLIKGKAIVWALFGNDEDGIYGDKKPGATLVYEHTWWGALRFWLRNPFHNALHHVLRWEGGPFWRSSPERPGWDIYIGFRPFSNPPGAFGMAFRYKKK